MKITLWIPAAESPRWPCVLSWLKMETPEDCEMTFVRSLANNPKYSWNKVVKDFLESDNDWLFSCHNDVCFDPYTLPRLLSWDKPLVSALVFMRNGLPLPHIWKSYTEQKIYIMRVQDTREWLGRHPQTMRLWGPQVIYPRPDDALAEIDFTSTSCTLIHRKVLEAIRDKFGEDSWFICDNDLNGGGEDRRFFERAREAGYPGYVDRSCIAGHLSGDTPVGVIDFMVWTSVSDIIGTGEKGKFTSESIFWTRGSEQVAAPADLAAEAVKMLQDGTVKIGGGIPDPEYFPPEKFWNLQGGIHLPKRSQKLKERYDSGRDL